MFGKTEEQQIKKLKWEVTATFKTGQSDFQFVKVQLIPFVASWVFFLFCHN